MENIKKSEIANDYGNVALVIEVESNQIPTVIVTSATATTTTASLEDTLAISSTLCQIVIENGNNDNNKSTDNLLVENQDFAGGNNSESEVESMLFEEIPTTSASSVTNGSAKFILEQTFCSIITQVLIPFLISGMGMVGAGFYFDQVKEWEVFKDIEQLIVLVPALVGLKGNLEMTLASRLSTQANLGNMTNLKSKIKLTFGNLCLVQCQAIVLSSLASVIALGIGWLLDNKFTMYHGLVLLTSSLATASLASFGLGLFTSFAVIISSACNVNPDNIAAPLAASLGDFITLFCLANISRYFHDLGDFGDFSDPKIWIVVGVLGICFLILPICLIFGLRSKSFRHLFKNGWTPIIIAVIVSSIAGYILKAGMSISAGIVFFQPVFCGIGGNIAAVQASRISTSLHLKAPFGILPDEIRNWWGNPLSTFFSSRPNSTGARALAALAIPGHITFFFAIQFISSTNDAAIDFIPIYFIAALIQVILMLYTAEVIVNLLWSKKLDPDNEAIPYLTAYGDAVGICLLGSAFFVYQWFNGVDYLA